MALAVVALVVVMDEEADDASTTTSTSCRRQCRRLLAVRVGSNIIGIGGKDCRVLLLLVDVWFASLCMSGL